MYTAPHTNDLGVLAVKPYTLVTIQDVLLSPLNDEMTLFLRFWVDLKDGSSGNLLDPANYETDYSYDCSKLGIRPEAGAMVYCQDLPLITQMIDRCRDKVYEDAVFLNGEIVGKTNPNLS